MQEASSSSSTLDQKPSGKRAIGIFSILQTLTTGDFFSELGQVSFAWRKNLKPTDGRCQQYTHNYSTYRVAQHNHILSRVAQDSGLHNFVSPTHLSSTCHVSFLAKYKFSFTYSSTSPVFPTVSPSQTSTMNLNPCIPCDGPRQSGGSTQIPLLPRMFYLFSAEGDFSRCAFNVLQIKEVFEESQSDW